ncbi:MAG: YraN family protein [Deltaproteobacteria bacterium]|nr:MAG: YraN family protein [Deltaproteobacteria bacterium]
MQGQGKSLGRMGEERAAAYLEGGGYEIVARNYRIRSGEIDIIARKGGILVFVEVKTRRSRTFGGGEESIDQAKQHQIVKTAAHYLQTLPPLERDIRFDVITVQISEGEVWISHIPDAFSTPEGMFYG